METKVLLPSHLASLQGLRDHVETAHLFVLLVDQTRFLWREVRPCIFTDKEDESSCHDIHVAYRMIDCLFDLLWKHDRVYQIKRCELPVTLSNFIGNNSQMEATRNTAFRERRLRWRPRKRKAMYRPRHCTILIVPSTTVKPVYSWEERLICLEHDLIRAQSVAGLISTLGGGYFMTRRLQTANMLAREQQRIALMLGNKEMYYKCTINQAYNEIYAGRFKAARLHILQVWAALAKEKHFDEKVVLQNMCKSAMLFRKRVRDARREVPPTVNGKMARVVDDFSRIRVVDDQSSHHDLTIAPLAHAKRSY